MSDKNIYETFRPLIQATIFTTVAKVRDTSTSYNWSLGKVITACAESCKLPLKDTPEDFKRIVKFEYNKLKDTIASDSGYELDRSKEDFILKDGQMKSRLTNIHSKFIALELQVQEAMNTYSRLGIKATDEKLSAEKRSAIRKKMNRYLVVADHCRAEIERQKKLQEEVKEQEQIKQDFKEIVKTIVEEAKA